MSITTELKFRVNLDEGLPLSPMEHTLMGGDQQAHCFMVKCYRSQLRQSVDLTGAQVHGYFIRNEKETIFLEGAIADNTATLTLPAACYAVEGSYSLVMKLRLGQVVHTVLWCRGKVTRTSTDAVIDPGQALPTLDELLAQIDLLEQTTTRAESVFNMTAQAYTLPAGKAATATYADGKLTLGIPKGRDSDTALPLGYQPYDMLVIGPDGKPHWEERTHYDYSGGGVVLPRTDLAVVGGYATFKEPMAATPVAGCPYRILYLGFEYFCTAIDTTADGKSCIVIGNESHMGQGLNTREPFIFVFYYPDEVTDGIYGWFSCSATDKSTIPLFIEGAGPLKQIDPKFLPGGGSGGGGGIIFGDVSADSEEVILCVSYKEKELNNILTYDEGVNLLLAGPLSCCLFLPTGEDTPPIFVQPGYIELISEAKVIASTAFIGASPVQIIFIFSDTIID